MRTQLKRPAISHLATIAAITLAWIGASAITKADSITPVYAWNQQIYSSDWDQNGYVYHWKNDYYTRDNYSLEGEWLYQDWSNGVTTWSGPYATTEEPEWKMCQETRTRNFTSIQTVIGAEVYINEEDRTISEYGCYYDLVGCSIVNWTQKEITPKIETWPSPGVGWYLPTVNYRQYISASVFFID